MNNGSASKSEILAAAGLDRLLHSFGIASEYIEFSGKRASISALNRLNMLAAMGVTPTTAADVEHLLKQREASFHDSLLPPVYLLQQGETVLHLNPGTRPAPRTLDWQLLLEDTSRHRGKLELQPSATLPLPPLPVGYHTLEWQLDNHKSSTLLIVAPPRCWQPKVIEHGEKLWGLSVQLYSVRSEHNVGIGDFSDLATLVTEAGVSGADFVLLNPLHYLDLRYPDNASPYSPSDRRFLNPLYLALSLCPDFAAAAVQQQYGSAEQQQTLVRLRQAPLVDYAGVAAFKLPLLAGMFSHFQRSEGAASQRRKRFRDFCARAGEMLAAFASLQAGLGIRPEPEFADAEFHCYLQWLCTEQLEACQRAALKQGMILGLVRDLAVGSSSDGAEVLGNPGLFCLDARVGAPPDYYNPHGQNWGLPPMLPEQLLQQRFRHYINLLRSNMQQCGALRIDHVMALMRLWWCPLNASNGDGAYVHYPVDVMFAILRLESVRNRCLVIGEDLGVVPPEIRRYLDEGAIYSNCVFYFERYDGWHFRKPEHYKQQALAMIANHDSPPLRAWWNRMDPPLRRKLGLLVSDQALEQDMQHRQGEKTEVLRWLAEQHLLPAAWQSAPAELPLDAELTAAIVRACARSASQLVSLQVDDLAGADTPVNVPGTCTEYPNWRRKLPLSLETLFHDRGAQWMLQALQEERPA